MRISFHWLLNNWKVLFIRNMDILFERIYKTTIFVKSLIKLDALIIEILVFQTCEPNYFFVIIIIFLGWYVQIKYIDTPRFDILLKRYFKVISYRALYIKIVIIFKTANEKEFFKMRIKFYESDSFTF